MVAVTQIRSVASTYVEMSDDDIGKTASGGYGADKRKRFISDIRELCRLAKITEGAGR